MRRLLVGIAWVSDFFTLRISYHKSCDVPHVTIDGRDFEMDTLTGEAKTALQQGSLRFENSFGIGE
jgi:hypothetical protein